MQSTFLVVYSVFVAAEIEHKGSQKPQSIQTMKKKI